jgi:hypothetical protein
MWQLLLKVLSGPSFLWRWGAIVAILAAGAGVIALKVHEHDTAVLRAEVDKQNARTQEIITRQKSITEATANDYETRITALRAHFVGWVPVGPTGKVPTVSCPASGTDGPAIDAVPVTDYRSLAAACAETTQQLISLQQWAQQQYQLTKGK